MLTTLLVRRWIVAAVATLGALTAHAQGASDPLLEQAKRLLAARDASRAYGLLIPHEQQRAGDAEYDYLLGVAALDAGEPQRAVFALERVLAVNPAFSQARAEIARAYFVLGEKQNAQREFVAVRDATDTPTAARATIEKYLSALSPARTTLSGYLEATYGFDTNVNSATALGSIAIPVFGGAVGTFSGSSRALRDSYVNGAGSITLSHRFTDYIAFVGTLGGSNKWNRHQDTFNTAGYDASAGLRITPAEAHAITIAAQAQSFRLDDTRFRDSSGVLAQWQWTRSPNSQLSFFGQWAMLGYPSQPNRDAYRTVGGVAYAHGFGGAWNPVAFASAYGLHEKPDDPENFSYYGNRGVGLRLGGQINLLAKLLAFATASHERRRYAADDPFFLSRRADHQTDYRAGLNYAFADRWSLIPSVAVTENRSNFDLYTYSRTLSSVALRRDF